MKKKYIKYAITSKKDENITLNSHYNYCQREGIPYVGIRCKGKNASISTDYHLNTEEDKIFKRIMDDNGFTHEVLINLGIVRTLNKNSIIGIRKLAGRYYIDVDKEYAEKIAEKVFDRFLECMQYAREEIKRRKIKE